MKSCFSESMTSKIFVEKPCHTARIFVFSFAFDIMILACNVYFHLMEY